MKVKILCGNLPTLAKRGTNTGRGHEPSPYGPAMPRQSTQHSRITYVFPDDFPQPPEWFQKESGLSRKEGGREVTPEDEDCQYVVAQRFRPGYLFSENVRMMESVTLTQRSLSQK